MKTFLIINTSFFGDTLLTDPLCRNIKKKYFDAKVIFIVNKPFFEAAKYMDGVDDVLCYDKKGAHKGLKGFWRFYQEYKQFFVVRPDAAFVIYGNERGILLSKLFGAKKIYSDNSGLFRLFLTNGKIDYEGKVHTQDKHAKLFALYTREPVEGLPMVYNPPADARRKIDELFARLKIKTNDELIALCTTSKRRDKDMDIHTCIKLIHVLHSEGKKVLFVGAGEAATAYAEALRSNNCSNFIDLTGKTSIAQLAEVIKRCRVAISVDTGTMHLVCAIGVPLIAVFYLNTPEHLDAWAPKPCYPHRLISGNDFSAEFILKNMKELQMERIWHE